MLADTIQVVAPSRLHFGMLSFGQPDTRQFGGVGVMIDRPGIRLTVSPSGRFEVRGPLEDRAAKFARHMFTALGLECEPACRIEIVEAPPQHVGLGTGTQLGLAVAAGLRAALGRDDLDYVTLAQLVGRGERSSIGTHGFAVGGLLVEAGKYEGEAVSPLVSRVEMPDEWRFVLLTLRGQKGTHGDSERRAFSDLPPVPTAATAGLCREVLLHLLPAASEARFERFSESLYRYGHMAGLCFSANQGGPFASSRLAAMVERIRQLEVHGVGQSSWGPTLFAVLPDQDAAERFAARLADEEKDLDLIIARPNNCGAMITRNP